MSENKCTQLYKLNVSASSLNLLLPFFVPPSADGMAWVLLAAPREGDWDNVLSFLFDLKLSNILRTAEQVKVKDSLVPKDILVSP